MKNKIINLLADNIEELQVSDIEKLIEIPPKPELGDFAFPCFSLAKSMRKAPNMIAEDIAAKIGKPDYINEIKIQGAYLNFFVNKEMFVKEVISAASDENYGSLDIGLGQKLPIKL